MNSSNSHQKFLEFLSTFQLLHVEFLQSNSSQILINKKILLHFVFSGNKTLITNNLYCYKNIIIHEDEWLTKQEIIISRLNSILGNTIKIHGRATKIVKLTKPEIVSFLEKNHLNSPTVGKYKFGLMYKNELVSVMTFSKACPIDRDEKRVISYNLLRFSHKLNHTVIGSFSKLLNHFIKEINPEDIVTYVDKEWSDGLSYEQFGFRVLEETEPLLFYLDPTTMIRFTENQLPENTDLNNYIKIENLGNVKLVLERNQND